MKKIIFIFGILIIIAFAIFAAINFGHKEPAQTEKISVVTTLFPLFDFAKNISGEKTEVSLLLPPGAEAHTFEPKPSDIAKINQADVFVYTGKSMEPWAEDLIKGMSGKNIIIVDSSAGISGTDPHIWLDFDNAKIMAENIAQAFQKTDPQNAEYYQGNLKNYQSKLADLDDFYKNTLSTCRSKTIVYGGHWAFGYLAKRYGLEYEAAFGISPDSEPSAKDLVKLVEQIKKNKIQFVFYEELVSPKIAETLAKETDAELLLLNPAHNLTKEKFQNNAAFISIMEDNLKNLQRGLICNK